MKSHLYILSNFKHTWVYIVRVGPGLLQMLQFHYYASLKIVIADTV